MNMQAHPQTLQRSQSYQSTMNPSGTVLQVQQIAQPPNAQPHMQPTHTIVVSQQQQQLQMPVQSMNQQMQPMHQQQHSKQFMTVNQGIVAVGQPPQPQMQQVPGGQGMPHQIQHSISNQNQSFQIQRIGGSPRPTGSAGTPAGQVSCAGNLTMHVFLATRKAGSHPNSSSSRSNQPSGKPPRNDSIDIYNPTSDYAFCSDEYLELLGPQRFATNHHSSGANPRTTDARFGPTECTFAAVRPGDDFLDDQPTPRLCCAISTSAISSRTDENQWATSWSSGQQSNG